MQKKIFVVTGETGRHEDHQSWMVRAFSTRRAAERWASAAEQRGKEVVTITHLNATTGNAYLIPTGMNAFDPLMRQDIGGTYYDVLEVPLGHPARKKKAAR